MSGQFRADRRTFRTSEAIAANLRVKVGSDGRIAKAGANENDIGVTVREAFAANEEVAVDLCSLQGTATFVSSTTIEAGNAIYGAAAGEIGTSSSTTKPIGIALTSGGDGDLIEVVRRQI
jgi:hypothetical protein